jgi:hypothetical protein
MDEHSQDPRPDGDGNRYASSRGWDPYRPKAADERALERKKKRVREKYHQAEAARAAIEVRAASDWLEDAEPPEPRRDLFPPSGAKASSPSSPARPA